MKTRLPLLLLATLALQVTAHPLELASPFVDDAILQREMAVPVWGWAKPGAKVTVSFADQKKTATADEQGQWRIKLDALAASFDERELKVESAGESLVRKGLLVGEVWFSSGQSNMDWLAGKSNVRDLAATLGRSKEPIREYTVDTGSSLFPQSRAQSEGGWKRVDQAGNFSALSLAFAAKLYEELKVPIGILRSTHGATPVETWTAYEGFADHPDLKDFALKIRQVNPTTADSRAAYEHYFEALRKWQKESEVLLNRGGAPLNRPALPGIADDWKGASRMFNKKIAPLVPYAIRGAIWCQGESNSNDGKIYAAKMEALVNGWRTHWERPDLPFYFTQLQCYGDPIPDQVGFADLREAQTLFFKNNKHIGMVAQHDLNPSRPQGIHPFNKLDPGKRMARWALAHDYGKAIAFTGPIYKSHRIKGSSVRVRFEQRGPGGSLIVGSKGQEGAEDFVEPARATPGEALNHFRLAGKDRVWHAARAVIKGNEVVVTSDKVSKPLGVQYAYSASPIGANLYNEAGLPAHPFAYFNGKQMFNEDDPAIVAAAKADAESRYGKRSYLLPSSLFRDRCVIQRDLPVPVWGHGIPGSEITVTFHGQTKKTTVGEFEYWRVDLDPMPATTKPQDLEIRSSADEVRTIRDVLVGDVWILTGSRNLSGETIRAPKGETVALDPLPLVREFKIKTKARRFPQPRKKRMEIGGGKYVASWQPADFDQPELAPTVAGYYFAAQVQAPDVPVGIVTLGAENPPITWVAYKSMQTAKGFEAERDELNLAYPNTDSCKKAVSAYIETIKKHNRDVAALLNAGRDVPVELADSVPPFPQPYYNQWVSRTETATHTWNFCISPLTPYAVRGVVWVPGKDNITEDVARYAPSLRAYAKSLPETYGQEKVTFLFAQPDATLVPGVEKPDMAKAKAVEISAWPKSLQELATKLGALTQEEK